MNNPKHVLGITVATHDTSASLLVDGELKVAIEEERLCREKHTTRFPFKSIQACLDFAAVSVKEIESVNVCWDLKTIYQERYIKNIFSDNFSELVQDRKEEITRLLEIEKNIKSLGFENSVEYHNHHECHTAYAFYTSPFNHSAFITLDGYGETESGHIGIVENGSIQVWKRFDIDNSLGLVYAALTHLLGFKPHCDEGIVMGLASYGDCDACVEGDERSYISVFREMILDDNEEIYRLDREYFSFGLRKIGWCSDKLHKLFGEKRQQNQDITQHHRNIAAALQKRTEEVIESIAVRLSREFPQHDNLCLSGGLALNCVANGKLAFETGFENIHVPSAPGDNGLSVGAALLSQHNAPAKKIMASAYLGPVYSDAEIDESLKLLEGRDCIIIENVNLHQVAKKLADGEILACYNGRSEFGPRALGNRSILSCPYPQEMKDILNKRVKFREEFRPFAPVILEEFAEEYFRIKGESFNMTKTFDSKEIALMNIPAALHVDGSGRVQTVNQRQNPVLYGLISAFNELTSIPVIINTSFNVKGQPIVEKPSEAIATFLSTNIDSLFFWGKYLITKNR